MMNNVIKKYKTDLFKRNYIIQFWERAVCVSIVSDNRPVLQCGSKNTDCDE